MRQKSKTVKEPAEKIVRDIRRKTRRRHSAEDKIRIVPEGLRGEPHLATAILHPKRRYLHKIVLPPYT